MKEGGRRFEENLEAARRLWSEESVNMKPFHFELNDAYCPLKPLQKPHPFFWIGANADRRAARMAVAWVINPQNKIDTILRQMGIYKRTLDKSKKLMPTDRAMMLEMFVARSRSEAVLVARPYLKAKYQAYHKWGQDKVAPRDDDDLGMSFDELLNDQFIFGSAEEIAQQIFDSTKPIGFNLIFCGIQ